MSGELRYEPGMHGGILTWAALTPMDNNGYEAWRDAFFGAVAAAVGAGEGSIGGGIADDELGLRLTISKRKTSSEKDDRVVVFQTLRQIRMNEPIILQPSVSLAGQHVPLFVGLTLERGDASGLKAAIVSVRYRAREVPE